MLKTCSLALSGLIAGGCATTNVQIPRPNDAESAGFGISIQVRISGLATYRADSVYFIKDCSIFHDKCAEQLITSSYAKEGRIYLLNAEPGEYKAVAAAFESGVFGDHSVYFAYFPATMTNASTIRVQQGQFKYAGSYLVSASLGLCPDSAEPAQLKYADLIEPATPKCGFWKTLTHKLATSDYVFIGGKAYLAGSQTFHYRGTGYQKLEKVDETLHFLENARGDLSEAGWKIGE